MNQNELLEKNARIRWAAVGQEIVKEFDEKDLTKVPDALLELFVQAYSLGARDALDAIKDVMLSQKLAESAKIEKVKGIVAPFEVAG